MLMRTIAYSPAHIYLKQNIHVKTVMSVRHHQAETNFVTAL
jgi:hypothetical protein